MSKLVNSSSFIVNGFKRTTNRPRTTNHQPRTNLGFTLIELIIVIAIIGIIGSIGFYGYQSSQQKARDAQRKSDLQQVKKALEHAKNDCLAGSYYPDAGGTDETEAFTNLSDYLIDADLNYLPQTISDPKNTNPYFYKLDKPTTASTSVCIDDAGTSNNYSGTKYYVLRAKLEIDKDPETNNSRTNCSNAITQVVFASDTPATDDGFFYVCPD